jgi:hypothetical protein
MIKGKRVKSALGWGIFYGICSWILAWSVSNKISNAGVWGLILTQTLLGLLIGLVTLKIPWWLRGLLLGAAVNLPVGFYLLHTPFVWTRGLFWPFVVSGVLFGVLIELGVRHSADPPL